MYDKFEIEHLEREREIKRITDYLMKSVVLSYMPRPT